MSAIAMPRIIKAYVRYVDAVNRVLGYFVMYLTLVIMAVLLFGSWFLATAYLYWQWFHYARQSYGIERAYRRKADKAVHGGHKLRHLGHLHALCHDPADGPACRDHRQ